MRCCCDRGQVVAAGPIAETLTSAKMSDTFGLPPLEVTHDRGRWTARAAQ